MIIHCIIMHATLTIKFDWQDHDSNDMHILIKE